MASSKSYTFATESYTHQNRCIWPGRGRHILAQYDEDTVVVYQAFKPSIAEYAVTHQKFGGDFSFERMSWIKTNFLWMMYRCGWASKHYQENVLAVRITRQGFEEILANAFTAELQKARNPKTEKVRVRLQWDPDHTPTYEKTQRRAIQLGLKKDILLKYATEWIVEIKDITPFVKEQRSVLKKSGTQNLLVASERVYPVNNPSIAARIQLDFYDDEVNTRTVVKGFQTRGAAAEAASCDATSSGETEEDDKKSACGDKQS